MYSYLIITIDIYNSYIKFYKILLNYYKTQNNLIITLARTSSNKTLFVFIILLPLFNKLWIGRLSSYLLLFLA